MAHFYKVVRIGTISVDGGKLGSRVAASIFCKIEYKDDKLSISGVVGPMRNGDALGSSGQIDMDFAHRDPKDNDRRTTEPIKPEEITFAPGWDAEKWLDFLDIWKRWHLNDMKAGCKHQTGPEWDTGKKEGLLGAPCPVCGYKYGTAWNKEEVPQEVIEWLQGLPDTDKIPAWV